MTSCVTCYVISNHTSFCYIVDSANEMHLHVIAQLCARVPKNVVEQFARLHIVVFTINLRLIPKCCFLQHYLPRTTVCKEKHVWIKLMNIAQQS